MTEITTTAQPIRSMCLDKVVSKRLPPRRTSPATRKKRAARPMSEPKKKPGKFNAATPAAIVNTLYGMGEKPATKMTQTP